MAKLLFKQEFELEVGDKIYKGVLNDLTKEQSATFNRANKQKKSDNRTLQKQVKDLKKLNRKIQVKENLEKWEEVEVLEEQKDELEDQIETLTEKLSDPKPIEEMFKKRLKLSVESDDLDEILQAGEDHGYQNVFQTILKDLEEKRAKK